MKREHRPARIKPIWVLPSPLPQGKQGAVAVLSKEKIRL